VREHLDCAVLAVPFNQERAQSLPGSYLGGRLLIEALALPAPIEDDTHALRESILLLRRYDACLLAVTPANLPWVRTNLQQVSGLLTTPIIALTQDLYAPALGDLFNLGISDFLTEPLCMQELRARCERSLVRHHALLHNGPRAISTTQLLALQAAQPSNADSLPASASTSATPPTSLPAAVKAELENYAITLANQGSSSGVTLMQAKKLLVEQFESSYVHAALLRNEGNVAMSARGASKHRRAFWELMCKYDIDASRYRVDLSLGKPRTARP